MKFPTIYSARVRDRVFGIDCSSGGRTKQSFRDECDINAIMRRYNVTGVAPMARGNPVYGDYSNVGDYMESLETLRVARLQFSGLSSDVRARFNNDPALMLAFVGDVANRDEAMKLGLLKAAEAVPPPAVVSPPDATK